MQDLSAKSAYELKTPYAFWQETEGIPMYDGYWIEDVRTVKLGDWPRTSGKGALVNLNGAGMNCDAHINEIAPKQQLNAERHSDHAEHHPAGNRRAAQARLAGTL